jgi:hypothetical protein
MGLPAAVLVSVLAATAAVCLLYLRVRNGVRWRRMIDTYADREIARDRKSLGRVPIRG